MAKGKSSASSATRKKHARKAAGPAPPPETLPKEKKQKGKDKGKNKEPRQKMYVAPVKPAPIQPDPLDTLGLARQLPPELLVVLRRVGKKDTVTKRRALEELQSIWVDESIKGGDDSPILETLLTMLPVWLHHAPALFLHPSKRIRLLAAGLQTSLLHIPAIREQIFFFIRETASADQAETILGTWCMASYDIDRQVSSSALKSWTDAIGEGAGKFALDETLLPSLLSFVQRSLLDPGGVYLYLNPPAPVAAPVTSKKLPGRSGPMRDESELATRTKGEGDDENEQDRKARLRVSAFGALHWVLDARAKNSTDASLDDLMDLFCNPALWTSLYHAETAPFMVDFESFGWNQPSVRRSAWAMLQTLLQYWKGSMQRMLPLLSIAVLRSAWVEPDTTVRNVIWKPLLTFLKEFPDTWRLSGEYEFDKADPNGDNDDESDSEDSGNDEMEAAVQPWQSTTSVISAGKLPAYREFLQFLELGCSGSPYQGYPAVVVIVSTIPSPILKPLTDFFTSFWAAIDGRALSSLDRATTSAAFLSSLLECTIFLARRLRNDARVQDVPVGVLESKSIGPPTGTHAASQLVGEQFNRVWDELVGHRLKVQPAAAGKLMAQTLASLERIDGDLFLAAWEPLATSIKAEFQTPNTVASVLVSTLIKVFDDFFEDGTKAKSATISLMRGISQWSLSRCEASLKLDQTEDSAVDKSVNSLIDILDMLGAKLFSDTEFVTHIDEITICNAYRLLSVSPSLLVIYISRRNDRDLCMRLWHVILLSLTQHPESLLSNLSSLLRASQKGAFPAFLKPQTDELDTVIGGLLTDVLDEPTNAIAMSVVSGILAAPGYFLSKSGFHSLFQEVVATFTYQVDHALRDSAILLPKFEAPLDLISAVYGTHPSAELAALITSIMPDIFIFAYLFPVFDHSENDSSTLKARHLWTLWVARPQAEQHTKVLAAIKETLQSLLVDSQVRPTSEDILRFVLERRTTLDIDILRDIFPSPAKIGIMLNNLPSDPIHSSLAVLDPHLPPPSAFKNSGTPEKHYDSLGYSSYVRIVSVLLQFLVEDRQAARQNLWALRHLLALSIYADDFLKIPTAPSVVFQPHVPKNLLEMIIKVQQITTYLLTSSTDDRFHLAVIEAASVNQPDASSGDLGRMLVELITFASADDNIRDSRILRRVLQHLFSDVSKESADQWMVLAKRLEKAAPQTSMAIVSSIAEFAPEPARLDRYRNELAAGLLGIRPTKVNTEGLLSLRKLAASAPDPNSEVVFLPQMRVINVTKACQQWITSDEDIDEEVESEMTLIFYHLAPLLQNVSGAHWSFIFDVIENNLENCSLADDSTLVALSRTLRLIIAIQDFTSTNRSLRGDWEERRMPIVTLVRDLVVEESVDLTEISVPRSTCRELVLSIVQDLPGSLIDHNTLSKMCHLLCDSSTEVQKMTYQHLREAAKKRTEYLVIETGVDTEDTIQAELPIQLIDILQRYFNQDEQNDNNLLGYLLGWMLVFDLFTDASLKVRYGYVSHLRNLDIITSHFIPIIFNLLNIYDGVKKAFKLEYWAVDEYYIDYYESTPLSLSLLASHLFFRALSTVPSLIRKWLLDCTDRQLSSSVVSYTSQYFSPVIIRTELAHVKSPEAAELADENMTIKVAQSVNEVTASYLVDEHQLEITLKMPSDWPLHTIEIKDFKKVGVLEDRWRAWVLGVQQIIWSQNGRIVDGLSLFKKNVSLHFEGQVECAICYSIISVMDGTLPQKPCRTCKNRFHASCLYKWFHTSHSSSCPLCRSDIM